MHQHGSTHLSHATTDSLMSLDEEYDISTRRSEQL